MWYTLEVVVKRSDLSNLGDRGSAEKVSNLLGVQDPCFIKSLATGTGFLPSDNTPPPLE